MLSALFQRVISFSRQAACKTGNDLRRVLAGLFAQKSVFLPPEIQS
jgi:hypothetical protein